MQACTRRYVNTKPWHHFFFVRCPFPLRCFLFYLFWFTKLYSLCVFFSLLVGYFSFIVAVYDVTIYCLLVILTTMKQLYDEIHELYDSVWVELSFFSFVSMWFAIFKWTVKQNHFIKNEAIPHSDKGYKQ